MCPVMFLGCLFAHDFLLHCVSTAWLNSEYCVGFPFFTKSTGMAFNFRAVSSACTYKLYVPVALLHAAYWCT